DRIAMTNALVSVQAREGVEILRAWLKDKVPGVRISSAKALGHLGAEEAIPDLKELLNEGDWNLQWTAWEALARLGDNKSLEQRREFLRPLRDVRLTGKSIQVLVEAGRTEFTSEIEQVLQGNDPTLWRVATEALGKLGAKESIPLLRSLLNFPGPSSIIDAA